jgi:Arc/MetJ-type ribon-helix-helix transcriptional regulator
MIATLPPDLREFVQAELARGEYANMDQMVEAAVRILLEQQEEMRAKVRVAIEQVDRGEVEPFDPVAEYEELTLELSKKVEPYAESDTKRSLR